MKFSLILLSIVSVAFAAEKPKRYQFGSVIKPDEAEGVRLELAGGPIKFEKAENATSTMVAKSIALAIDPMKYRRTMVTIPIPEDFKGDDYSDLVRPYSCVETKFLKMDDLKSKEKVPNGALVIVTDEIKPMDAEVCKNLKECDAKVGFLRKNKPLEDSCRNALIDCGVKFAENLDMPEGFNQTKRYFAFKQMFVPFKNATVMYGSGDAKPKSLTALADYVMFEGDERFSKFCQEQKDKIAVFNQKVIREKIPVLEGVEQPHFITEAKEAMHWLRFSGQTGTHIVAPYRFEPSKTNIVSLNDRFFFSPCSIISVPFNDSPNFRVTKDKLEKWEKDNGRQLAEGSAVLINTGFWKNWDKEEDKYQKNFPGIDLEALKWLVEERKVAAIGIDSLVLDDYSFANENKFPAHGYLAEKDIPALANLRFEGADMLPEGSRCVFSYLRIDKGTTAPLALFGLPGYDKFEISGGEVQKGQKKVVETVVKVEEAKPSNQRWQFGRVIRNKTEGCLECSLRDVAMEGKMEEQQQRMILTETKLVVDPSVNKITTITAPKDVEIAKRSSSGCIKTLFIKTVDLETIKKRLANDVQEGMLVIFVSTDLVKLHDPELLKAAKDKKVLLGFLDDISLTDEVRKSLLENNLPFIENLARPEGFNPEQIDEHRIYYSFKLIFAPMEDETSLQDSLKAMEPPRKINLVDVVILDNQEISERCLQRNYITLSRNWSPVDKIPIVQNMQRPKYVDKQLSFFDHFGTHIDSPAHMNRKSDVDVTKLPETLNYPVCLKVDVLQQDEANFLVTKQHLLDWEKKSGIKIPENSMVIIETGFGKNWEDVQKYQQNFPGLAIDAAQFLVDERKVVAIGIDSLTIDNYATVAAMAFPVHEYIASKNVVAIENIGGEDLSKMTSDGSAHCVMSYLRSEKVTGSPVALFAVMPEKPVEKPQTKEQEKPREEEKPKKEEPKKASATKLIQSSVVMFLPVLFLKKLF